MEKWPNGEPKIEKIIELEDWHLDYDTLATYMLNYNTPETMAKAYAKHYKKLVGEPYKDHEQLLRWAKYFISLRDASPKAWDDVINTKE